MRSRRGTGGAAVAMSPFSQARRRPRARSRSAPTAERGGPLPMRELRGEAAQPHVGVVLERLGDRAIGLAQGGPERLGRLGERSGQGGGEEVVSLLAERKGASLAATADDAARARREAREVLGIAAGRARGELGEEARG